MRRRRVGNDAPMSALGKLRAILEERLALMAPARRLRLRTAERMLGEFADGRPLRVLDAGCGDGLLTLALAKRHPDWHLLGIDLREDLLDGARKRAAGRGLRNVEFERADLLRPLPFEGFEAVTALECLSEIPDDRAALAAMAAAASPGAAVAVQVPDRDWRPVLPGSATSWREQVRQGYTRGGIEALLAETGLEGVEVRGTYHSLAAAAQEIRDRIKGTPLPVRLLAFPFLAGAVRLESLGLTWGRPNAIFAVGRRPSQ
jgi:trans-aconitate methyltransferase